MSQCCHHHSELPFADGAEDGCEGLGDSSQGNLSTQEQGYKQSSIQMLYIQMEFCPRTLKVDGDSIRFVDLAFTFLS